MRACIVSLQATHLFAPTHKPIHDDPSNVFRFTPHAYFTCASPATQTMYITSQSAPCTHIHTCTHVIPYHIHRHSLTPSQTSSIIHCTYIHPSIKITRHSNHPQPCPSTPRTPSTHLSPTPPQPQPQPSHLGIKQASKACARSSPSASRLPPPTKAVQK